MTPFVPKVRENIPYFGLYFLEEYQIVAPIVPYTTIGVPKTSKKGLTVCFKILPESEMFYLDMIL